MCGRYSLSKYLEEIAAYFAAQIGHEGLWTWEPNYNISPGTIVPVIAHDGKRVRKVVPMRWGLHPHWKKAPPEGRPLFNARVETAGEKPSFRTPFRRRRALIPMTGWYEWEGVERPKTPYYIHDDTDDISAFAGLWDQWRVEEGVTLLSCTILTTAALGPIKHLHHRMPLRLPQDQWENWLSVESTPDKVLQAALAGDDLTHYEVDKAINSGRALGAELISAVK